MSRSHGTPMDPSSHQLTRRRLLHSGAGLAAFALFGAGCGSEGSGGGAAGGGGSNFPTKNVDLIIQAAPGGTSDLVARTAAKQAESDLGRQIVAENRPGASGSIAMQAVAGSEPDGYTIGYTPVEVALLQFLGFEVKPESFAFISQLNSVPAAIAVKADSPYKTLDDFLEAAKEKPGELSVGNSGPGSIWHVATAALGQEAGVKLKAVPFDGGAPAATALAGGKIDATSVGVSEVYPSIKGGKLRALAVLADERGDALPDVPTAKEAGHDLTITAWGGVAAPADTPGPVIDRLAKAFQAAVRSDMFTKTLSNALIDPVYRGPDEFTSFVMSEQKKFEGLASALGRSQ